MTTGLVLIAAILVLGAVVATVGDRLGMKVGKARLSLFGLRPRQTATLITVMTGILISAMTFGILFAVDDQLRTGVFELEDVQQERDAALAELNQAQQQTAEVQRQRDRAEREQQAAQRRLRRTNESLQAAIAQETRTREELQSTQSQLSSVAANYQQAQTLLTDVSQQATQLRAEIQQLQADRQRQLAQRDRDVAERDRQIAERTAQIREKELQLDDLEAQRSALLAEVQTLEREFQGLRQGSVAVLRNQPMASGVVRVITPEAAPSAVNRLLLEANRFASQRIQPGTVNVDKQVIQITNAQVEQLINQIQDGKDYVVRILSAGNYIIGEPCVLAGEACIQVYVNAAPNQVVFREGDLIVTIALDPTRMRDEELVQRVNLLIANAQFRSRQAGVLGDVLQIADGQTEAVVRLLQDIRAYGRPVELHAIASETIFTAGPVRLDLAAVQNGRVLFSTDSRVNTTPPPQRSPFAPTN
ncbi:DUF3084 domain-containing protein [Thermoleptolyngbya oregonensis NK1-22]|uniref:DUF3084 domain-containing protein n=1 Tax=Thermoleptolyngbya oregonensis NK1-22 TaxID=2547457 RepID=A0AA96Y5A1_9CYAN|nr:DUF3084 domain-containing protein [Thermoleptolyngbya oregonensis NK1-22]